MQSPLKILCVEPYSLMLGHFRWFAAKLCGGLARRGHEVTLLTFGNAYREEYEDAALFSVIDLVKENPLTRILTRRGPVRNQLGAVAGFQRFYFDFCAFPRAFRMATRKPYDIVHYLDWHPVSLWWTARLFSIPRPWSQAAMVGTLHHLGRLARGKDLFLGMSVRYYRKALVSLIRNYMQAVFVLDESFRTEILERFDLTGQDRDKIVTIPHGMDTGEPPYGRAEARRRLGISGDEKALLFIGALRKERGIDIAIRAMEGSGSCRLYIAGVPSDCDVDELRSLIRACNCENTIVLEPRYLTEDKIQDYLLACDALLLPYRRTFRGQSGIIARACRCARCVIASDVAAVGETVRQFGFGFTVEPESPEKLRDTIRKFLDLTPKERLEMESNAKLASRFYSWDEVCGKIEEVYYRCAANRA